MCIDSTAARVYLSGGQTMDMRSEKEGPYELLTADDMDALRTEFDAHGRSGVLDA